MAYKKIIFGDEVLIDLSEDTVTPETMLNGMTAHDHTGEIVTGTIESVEGARVTPTKSEQIVDINGRFMTGDVVVDPIPNEFVDTSNADATESDILVNKTAYVNGEKLTGTNTFDADTSDATVTSDDILGGKIAYANSERIVGNVESIDGEIITPSAEQQTVETSGKYVTGDILVEPIPERYQDTSDATATADDLVAGKTAYTSTGKIEGTIEKKPISSFASNMMFSNRNQQVMFSFDPGLYMSDDLAIMGSNPQLLVPYVTKVVEPDDTQHVITSDFVPGSPQVLRSVTVEPVANLLPENIREGVTVGGVLGTFKGGASMDKLMEIAIKNSAVGSRVAVRDAANFPIDDLIIYGKSLQLSETDDLPDLEENIESPIESLCEGNPIIFKYGTPFESLEKEINIQVPGGLRGINTNGGRYNYKLVIERGEEPGPDIGEETPDEPIEGVIPEDPNYGEIIEEDSSDDSAVDTPVEGEIPDDLITEGGVAYTTETWFGDILDIKRKQIVRHIGKIKITADLNWVGESMAYIGRFYRFPVEDITTTGNGDEIVVMSNYFKGVGSRSIGSYMSIWDGGPRVGEEKWISLCTNGEDTLDEFLEKLRAVEASGKEIYAYYILGSPRFESLDDLDVDSIIGSISTTAPACIMTTENNDIYFNVTYVADPNIYIANLIDEKCLEVTNVSMGGILS